MGHGDNIMASGMARGARARGVRVAFGDGRRILWDQHSDAIFRGNPNVAKPGEERSRDLEWIQFHRGNRQYNRHDMERARWTWNYDFRPRPGEIYLTGEERRQARSVCDSSGFVLIEPNLPEWKACAPNKRWPVDRYQRVASSLIESGIKVLQLSYGGRHVLRGVRQVRTVTFRDALAVLERAALYVGPEGGLHHGAAALGVGGVVLFGGWIPPQVTGYDSHCNISRGEACGMLHECLHCRDAMLSITCDEVFEAARAAMNMREAS